MSDLFSVMVTAVSKKSTKLLVRSVHPDSGPPKADATFAIRLLYGPIYESFERAFAKHAHLATCPLAREMSLDDYRSLDWVRRNARSFVAEATVTVGVVEVRPTHPAWIEHLRVGMVWHTAAYPAGPGDPAEPRVPAQVAKAASKKGKRSEASPPVAAAAAKARAAAPHAAAKKKVAAAKAKAAAPRAAAKKKVAAAKAKAAAPRAAAKRKKAARSRSGPEGQPRRR